MKSSREKELEDKLLLAESFINELTTYFLAPACLKEDSEELELLLSYNTTEDTHSRWRKEFMRFIGEEKKVEEIEAQLIQVSEERETYMLRVSELESRLDDIRRLTDVSL